MCDPTQIVQVCELKEFGLKLEGAIGWKGGGEEKKERRSMEEDKERKGDTHSMSEVILYNIHTFRNSVRILEPWIL